MTNRTPKKREWKPRFLKTLAATGNVTRAASRAGISRSAAYAEYKKSTTFADAWDEAIEIGMDRLEEEARRRAYRGTKKPVFYKGFEVGAIREYSDTLMIFLLKGGRPEKYADRLKQELTGKDGGPVEHSVKTERPKRGTAAEIREIDRHIAELDAEIAALEAEAGGAEAEAKEA